jgi:hypothetical protein
MRQKDFATMITLQTPITLLKLLGISLERSWAKLPE